MCLQLDSALAHFLRVIIIMQRCFGIFFIALILFNNNRGALGFIVESIVQWKPMTRESEGVLRSARERVSEGVLRSARERAREGGLRRVKYAASLFTATLIAGVKPALAVGLYEDKENGWSITVPPGWSSMRRTIPTAISLDYTIEEVMYVASSFAEGASLSVSKTRAPNLLKDFKIDWWFAPLLTMKDVGSPELIAKLLILQRQGAFEKKETVSEITTTEIDGNKLQFEFISPLASNVNRKTIVKSFLKDGVLYTIWISALNSIYDNEDGYGPTLYELRNSFKLKLQM